MRVKKAASDNHLRLFICWRIKMSKIVKNPIFKPSVQLFIKALIVGLLVNLILQQGLPLMSVDASSLPLKNNQSSHQSEFDFVVPTGK
jgi:hypothetical protein